MQLCYFHEMVTETWNQSLRHQGGTIYISLSCPHRNGATIEIDILYPQSDTFTDSHARAIDDFRHQTRCPAHPGKCCLDLANRYHDGDRLVALNPSQVFQAWHVHLQDGAVPKGNRVQGSGLRAGRNSAPICQMIQIALDFLLPHLVRMTFIVKEDKLANPKDIRFFSLWAVVFLAAGDSDLIK